MKTSSGKQKSSKDSIQEHTKSRAFSTDFT